MADNEDIEKTGEEQSEEMVEQHAFRVDKGQESFRIDKFLRQNTSHVLIKKVSSVKDLKLILSEFSLNCDIADLKRMYDYCTKRFEDIMLIDLLHGQIFHNFMERIL